MKYDTLFRLNLNRKMASWVYEMWHVLVSLSQGDIYKIHVLRLILKLRNIHTSG